MINGDVILGLGCAGGHDSGASLIVGNDLICAIEEERLTRIKNDSSFPYESIRFCMNEGNISYDQIDKVVIGWSPNGNILRKAKFLFYNSLHPKSMYKKIIFLLNRYAINQGNIARKIFANASISFIEHHLAHAAGAFFASPFERAGIITLDGRGEWCTGILGIGENGKIKKIKEAFFPQSLGMLYFAFTNYLGFEIHDEYKVMGLAAYGKSNYLDKMRKIVRFDRNKIFYVDLRYLQHPSYSYNCEYGKNYWTPFMESSFGPPRKPNEEINSRHMDIACSLQTRLNEVGVEIAEYLIKSTSVQNLCLSGGVCLNGVMNYHIYKELSLKNIFIQPAASDGGVSLGAALYAYHCINGNRKRIKSNYVFLGSEYSNEDIEKELCSYRVSYHKLTDASLIAAHLISRGKIIGWFQGRSELGPRALGARSILADPRPAANKDLVNARIKFREEFRPFAPSVLEEKAREWFDIDIKSPYMLLIPPVKEEMRGVIQAVTHVNGTARPQTVSKVTNPRYYSLIESFYKLTDCPMVLNTSFNIKGEPIVNSPTDALRCFFSTGLDYLILGDIIVSKKMSYEEIVVIENIINEEVGHG